MPPADHAPTRTTCRRRATRVLATALALLLPACGGPEPTPTLAVRDSAGIWIGELDADALPAPVALDTIPEFVLGGGDSPLYRVAHATLAPDGSVLVAEGSTQQILRFHPETGAVERTGGAGDGPTEFQALTWVQALEDGGVAAYDSRRRRYVELGADGSVRHEASVPSFMRGGSHHLVVARDGTRYLAGISSFPSPPVMGTHRGEGPLVRLGEVPDTLTMLPGSTVFMAEGMVGAVLFGATTLVAASAEGVWVGDNGHREVVEWRAPGRPARIVRWASDSSRAVTDAVKEQLWQRLEEAAPPEQRGMITEVRETFPVADSIPAFGALLSARGGDLWIGAHVPPEVQLTEAPWPAQEWLVVHPDHGTMRRVRTPAGLRVLEMGDDYVLGVHRDELGEETVRLYRLEGALAVGPGS